MAVPSWRAWIVLALGTLSFDGVAAYTVEELIKADHSIAMKLAVEEDRIEVMEGVLQVFKDVRKIPLSELCTSHSNIFHYADYTPLHYATLLNRGEHIRLLIQAGCSPDLETDTGMSPLHAAADEGSDVSVKVLLENGANPAKMSEERIINNNDVPRRGFGNMNAATMAAKKGHVAALRALQEFGGAAAETLTARDFNGLMSERGWAPLHYAVSKGHRDAYRFLAFEVGWGSLDKAEVVAAADAAHRAEVEALAKMEGSEFEKQRERYLAEVAKKAGAEL